MSRLRLLFVSLAAVLVASVAYSHAPSGPISGHIQELTHGLAPDGGLVVDQSTAAGIKKITHDGMCVDIANCQRVTATNVNDGGTLTVTAGKWYELKVSGTGGDGCASQSGYAYSLTTCAAAGRFPMEAGERWRDAFRSDQAVGIDGGSATNATLFFLATGVTTMAATLCPVVPCQ